MCRERYMSYHLICDNLQYGWNFLWLILGEVDESSIHEMDWGRWRREKEKGGLIYYLLGTTEERWGGCWQPTEDTPSPPYPHRLQPSFHRDHFYALAPIILFSFDTFLCTFFLSLKGFIELTSCILQCFQKSQLNLGKLNGDPRWYLRQIIFGIVWEERTIFLQQKIFKTSDLFVAGRNWRAGYANWELCGGEVGGRIILIMQILQTSAIFPNTGVRNLNSFQTFKVKEYIFDTLAKLFTHYSIHSTQSDCPLC